MNSTSQLVPAGSVTTLPATYIETARRQRQERRASLLDIFDALWSADYGELEKERWMDLWEDERRRWLQKQRSPATAKAYEASLEELRRFMRERFAVKQYWFIEPYHVVAWMNNLTNAGGMLGGSKRKGLQPRTINRHLAAASSFFKHVCSCTRMVDGEQVGLYISAAGHPLPNPFENQAIARPKITPYNDSKAIPTQAIRWIIDRLIHRHEKSPSDYRDLALLLTFYRTGYRSDSVLTMKWGDFEERTDGKAGAIHDWKGKGGKEKKKALPAMVYASIIAYLKDDGRWSPGNPWHITPDEYIWRPQRLTGCANFTNVDPKLVDENRHIAPSTATGILQKHLRHFFAAKLRKEKYPEENVKAEAGRLARRYHLHCLRHSFASELAQASGDNIMLVQALLDHESADTTKIYIGAIKQPEDKASDLLAAEFGY